jgi:hypothetical protein
MNFIQRIFTDFSEIHGDRAFPSGYSGFAIGVDRSEIAFRGFLSRKTTPRELFGTTVIAKPL